MNKYQWLILAVDIIDANIIDATTANVSEWMVDGIVSPYALLLVL